MGRLRGAGRGHRPGKSQGDIVGFIWDEMLLMGPTNV